MGMKTIASCLNGNYGSNNFCSGLWFMRSDSKTEHGLRMRRMMKVVVRLFDENGDESQENVVLGEVKSVSDSEITIMVGTMKEMGQPGGDGQNGGAN